MGYLGNTPTTQGFTPAVDVFSGNGSTTAFTLSRPVASVAQVQAFIENVPQSPVDAFTVSGNTITFTSAPPSGSSNIYVRYTSPITQVITPTDGTVGTSKLVDGAVTVAKLSGSGVPSFDGIKFPASQVLSADANTLDDYEEGTWTPVLTRTGQTITQTGSGSYVKVGRLITITAFISVSSVSGTGSSYLTVSGAPFAASQPSGTTMGMCGAMMYNNACATDARCAEIQNSTIYFMPLGSGASEIQADAKIGAFAFQVTYMTA